MNDVMKVTVRVEINLSDGNTNTIEVTTVPKNAGDPALFGEDAEQSARAAGAKVRAALEAVHGTAPQS